MTHMRKVIHTGTKKRGNGLNLKLTHIVITPVDLGVSSDSNTSLTPFSPPHCAHFHIAHMFLFICTLWAPSRQTIYASSARHSGPWVAVAMGTGGQWATWSGGPRGSSRRSCSGRDRIVRWCGRWTVDDTSSVGGGSVCVTLCVYGCIHVCERDICVCACAVVHHLVRASSRVCRWILKWEFEATAIP